MVMTHPDSTADGKTGTVTGNVVNLRALPGTNYELVAKLKFGDKVKVVGEKSDWFHVEVPAGAAAWVSSKFLDKDGKVIPAQLRVRSGPTANHSDYHMLKRGDLVKKAGEPTKDGWQKIEVPAGAAAWAKKEFVKLDGAAASSVLPSSVPSGAPAATREAGGAATSGAAKPADGAMPPEQKEPPKAADATAPVQPVPPQLDAGAKPLVRPFSTTYAGTVTSLGAQTKEGVLTHLLSVRRGDVMQPVAYLVSRTVALGSWDGRGVKILEGQEVWYPGWKRPVLMVTLVEAAE